MNPKEALNYYFGYPEFRQAQAQVIDEVMKGKNVVVIMPTGAGKSLCYQIPALCLEGVTIVVSPLIALMKDQVDALLRRNIPATFINSSLSAQEINGRIEAIKGGEYKLVYVAPERFNDPEFIDKMKDVKISLFAVDEAHCISEWGHDFRPSYARMHRAVVQLGNPKVIALTATATPEVREDIVKQLNLADYELFVTGFDRPNLDFQVVVASRDEKLYRLLDYIKNAPTPGIIYAGTRNNADQVSEILNLHDIKAINYHAGLTPEERRDYQEAFMKDEFDVMVATNAFGMGVDKSNIRFVVHYDLPGTVEAYYQEAGRAGRDGQYSQCLLLYNHADRYLREFFLKGDNPSRENIEEIYSTLTSYPSEPVLMTYSEIKNTLSDQVPEMTIGTALKLLERHGYIEMKGENEKDAFVQFLYPIQELMSVIGSRSKKKLEVVEYLNAMFGVELEKGLNCKLETIIENSHIKRDAFMRSLTELKKKELIAYEPPFRGKEIYIKKRVLPVELELDWKALNAKLERDMDKLNAMEGYIFHQGDKRKYILDYFGER